MMYAATYRGKNGKEFGATYAETREEAAKLLFDKYPRCKVASTCRAMTNPKTNEPYQTHMDIRWINRPV